MSEVTEALLQALDRVDLRSVVERARPADAQPAGHVEGASADQFFRAFRALLCEALDGGREQRDLVMETAVPALVEYGQSSLDLLEGHVRAFTALAPELTAAVPEHLRADAGVWLARYAATFTREVVERAQRAEAGEPA